MYDYGMIKMLICMRGVARIGLVLEAQFPENVLHVFEEAAVGGSKHLTNELVISCMVCSVGIEGTEAQECVAADRPWITSHHYRIPRHFGVQIRAKRCQLCNLQCPLQCITY